MTVKRLIIAVAGLALCTSPVSAQSQPGSSGSTGSLLGNRQAEINGNSVTDARQAGRQYGQCIVKRSPARAAAVAMMPVDSRLYSRSITSLAVDDCLSEGEMSFPYPVIRTAIIESLYLRQVARSGPTDFSDVPRIDYAAGYQRPLAPEAVSTIALAQFGDCVSRGDGEGARNLVFSTPGSVVEGRLMTQLMPSFSACTLKGSSTKFSRTMLRGAVVEGLYRLTLARMAAAK